MEQRLEVMNRAFEKMLNEDRGKIIYPEQVLVWLNYVKTGDLELDGVGRFSKDYLIGLNNDPH